MSSHCNRYPENCVCPKTCGIYCYLPDNDIRVMEPMKTKQQEEKLYVDYELHNRSRRSKHAKPTNYTPPKKKRRKR